MKNIGSIDTYDYEKYYEDNFGRKEERLLTLKELHDLYFMCETSIENKFSFMLGFAPCSCSFCIHKTPENKWIVSDCGERRDGYIYGIFDNIYDACILLINECIDEKDRTHVISEFDSKLNNEISNEELKSFAFKVGYYDEYFYYDFQQTIKKMSGIEVTEDSKVYERISNRKNRLYPSGVSFGELVRYFVDNIARTLNIDTSDLYDEWNHGKIDYETYNRLKMERIDLKEHQDLVLSELRKYINKNELSNDCSDERLQFQKGQVLCKKLKPTNK